MGIQRHTTPISRAFDPEKLGGWTKKPELGEKTRFNLIRLIPSLPHIPQILAQWKSPGSKNSQMVAHVVTRNSDQIATLLLPFAFFFN
jgi:hypothetical protein